MTVVFDCSSDGDNGSTLNIDTRTYREIATRVLPLRRVRRRGRELLGRGHVTPSVNVFSMEHTHRIFAKHCVHVIRWSARGDGNGDSHCRDISWWRAYKLWALHSSASSVNDGSYLVLPSEIRFPSPTTFRTITGNFGIWNTFTFQMLYRLFVIMW